MKQNKKIKLPEFSQLTIKEVKKFTAELKVDENLPKIITILKQDSRQGVQKIAARLQRKISKKEAVIEKWKQMNEVEADLYTGGYQLPVGLDEAGRGPLAGPLFVGLFLFDSKKNYKNMLIKKLKDIHR